MGKVPTGAEWLKMSQEQRNLFLSGGKPKKKKTKPHKRKKTPKHLVCEYGKRAEPSPTEDRIRAILNGYAFEFLTEVSFKGFQTPKKQYYRFDFYIPHLKTVIEYDGSEHKELERKGVDRIKDTFCREHGIFIKRFSSKHWPDLETHITKFIAERICEKNRREIARHSQRAA